MALYPGLPGWAHSRKLKPIWILLKQETMSGSGISWAICMSAPHSWLITMPAPHHWVFYCTSCRPTNSVKALANHENIKYLWLQTVHELNVIFCTCICLQLAVTASTIIHSRRFFPIFIMQNFIQWFKLWVHTILFIRCICFCDNSRWSSIWMKFEYEPVRSSVPQLIADKVFHQRLG